MQSITIAGARPAPDAARAVRGYGLGPAAHSLLSAMPAAASADGRNSVRRAGRDNHLCGRGACPHAARTVSGSMRASIRSRSHATMTRRASRSVRDFSRRRHRLRQGPQAAGIILDNWRQGRRRALWISQSDKLLEDAQRDWSALGQEKLLIVPQSRYRPGTPIVLPKASCSRPTPRCAGASARARLPPYPINDWLGHNPSWGPCNSRIQVRQALPTG